MHMAFLLVQLKIFFNPQQLDYNVDVITSERNDNSFTDILKRTQNTWFKIIMQNAV